MEESKDLNDLVPEKERRVVKKFSETRIQVKEFTHTWVIKNFIHWKNRGTGYSLTSPKFSVLHNNDKYEWQLEVYPTSTNYPDSLCLLLKRISSPTTEKEMNMKVSLLDKQGVEDIGYESFVTIYPNNNITLSLLQFAMKEDVFKNALTNGNLTIECQMNFEDGFFHDSDPDPSTAIVDEITALTRRLKEFDDLELLLKSAKFSDVKLVCGEVELSAHKSILSARSRVFSAMFEHEMRENKENTVEIKDVEPEVMREVLRFIYAGKVKDLKELAGELLVVADKYELDTLKAMCEQVLISGLSLENVGKVLALIDRHDTGELREATMRFFKKHGSDFAAMENFNAIMKSLSSDLLADVTKAVLLRM